MYSVNIYREIMHVFYAHTKHNRGRIKPVNNTRIIFEIIALGLALFHSCMSDININITL